jgi:nucleotide-binding universal stress UspA family protein
MARQVRRAHTVIIERILVPIDHSEQTPKVIKAAAVIAQKFDAEVVVVHVEEKMAWDQVAALWPPPPEVEERIAERQLTLLERDSAELMQNGVRASFDLISSSDSAAKGILVKAEDMKANLIVMGSRGRSQIAGLLLGSVSHQVIQLAHCPVLVVH